MRSGQGPWGGLPRAARRRPMEKLTLTLENGDVLEFRGELVAEASREVALDVRRSTVFEYRLYRREDGEFLLVLDSFEKIRSRQFHLHFNTLDDARDYVLRDKGSEELVRELFGVSGPGADVEG